MSGVDPKLATQCGCKKPAYTPALAAPTPLSPSEQSGGLEEKGACLRKFKTVAV